MSLIKRKKKGPSDELPVLTELSDTSELIPVLTETLSAQSQLPIKKPGKYTDEQCREIAAELAPQLEALLREKFQSQFEALWQTQWREIEKKLPALIRTQLNTSSSRAK